MRRMVQTVGILAGAAVVAAVVTAATSTTGADAKTSRAKCTFSNPAHAGECVEVTEVDKDSTARDACVAILDCLNNSRCTKVYCNASTVRQGWRLVAAEALEE